MAKKRLINRLMSKFFGGGLLFLSNISLISVGFSAWSIGTVGSAEAYISVGVEDVYNFIYTDASHVMSPFSLGNDGFIQDGMVLSSVNVSYYFKIDVEKFGAVSNDKSSVTVNFALSEEKPRLVNEDFLSGIYHYDSNGENKFADSGTLSIASGNASGTFDVNGVSGEEDIPFAIQFTFSISDFEKYTSLISTLTDSSYFTFSMKVTGEPK